MSDDYDEVFTAGSARALALDLECALLRRANLELLRSRDQGGDQLRALTERLDALEHEARELRAALAQMRERRLKGF